jgi:hypothetical protein
MGAMACRCFFENKQKPQEGAPVVYRLLLYNIFAVAEAMGKRVYTLVKRGALGD